uniref:RRM domain-containing protein n=1 Tax=Paramoeba aestuarina TaxID=180227 RepID=A0A7S4UIH8_9EUKA|mmetsp:Transcript_35398/g.55237  ORF Transcript_35398/g.55237 Transcript_35398/m.55237 type:complete len:234 (+) Transcript_35398:46-747(+)|eukprot:CAMPEP_0201520874 /NCGR_PEP_ID=MMETSP0161_2-20130828/13056_1 /ASSEMBLY_ACC=CAM_ASM_000251 /TAXON_ID=180227 /ORGANISM="Neoparamoeba aestuarina, Strain SoJaBio B1-5/56/2" /LENGTH=233 /DNA_ID=CAMNT_0047919387 /DNA_START=33 /DNA_END=734 /DNA_ORIENTATION=+
MSESISPNSIDNTVTPNEHEYPGEHQMNSHGYGAYGMMDGMGYGNGTISSSISTVSAYVGNLHPSTTKEDLQQLFASCGNIRRVTVPVHPTGQIKGCGYVEFEDNEGLQRALQLHNSTLNGHTIDVYAKRDTVRDMRAMMRGRGRGYPMMNPYAHGYSMPGQYGRGMMMPYGSYPNYGSMYMGGRGMQYPQSYGYSMSPYGSGAPYHSYGESYGPQSTGSQDGNEANSKSGSE